MEIENCESMRLNKRRGLEIYLENSEKSSKDAKGWVKPCKEIEEKIEEE
jgi:hypothetical protein